MKYNSLVLFLFTIFEQVIYHLYKYFFRNYLLLSVLVISAPFMIRSQLIFEQGLIQGGITGAGFSTGQGFGSGTFEIHIEPGSTIKKAYFFTYTQRYPPPANFILNGSNIVFDTNNLIMNVDVNFPSSSSISPAKLYYMDATNQISPSITTYNITIPIQSGLPINEGYWTFFLVVIYENPLLSKTPSNDPAQMIGIPGLFSAKYLRVLSASGHS